MLNHYWEQYNYLKCLIHLIAITEFLHIDAVNFQNVPHAGTIFLISNMDSYRTLESPFLALTNMFISILITVKVSPSV